MQILTINEQYNLYVFNITEEQQLIKCSYTFSQTKYPDLNDFIMKYDFKPLSFRLAEERFEGILEQYSFAKPPISKGMEKKEAVDLNEDIYGFTKEDIKNMHISVQEFLDSTIYGLLAIRRMN